MPENLRRIKSTKQYNKDFRKISKQGKDLGLIDRITDQLANDIPLAEKHRDHPLKGEWLGFRECHITPDLLLIYQKTDKNELILVLVSLCGWYLVFLLVVGYYMNIFGGKLHNKNAKTTFTQGNQGISFDHHNKRTKLLLSLIKGWRQF